MSTKRMSTYTRSSAAAGHDEWGDPWPAAGVTVGIPDFAPVWQAPDGERVPVRFRTSNTRASAIERVARQIARRPDLRLWWELSAASGASYLRHHGWRLLPDDGGAA